ncbi:MAG: DNA replication/repair protein RecF [Alphaproteobacteria bacterium]|nr:DNA replication/repair protein RecF [Alphaproteobacteria bacterium]
MVGLYQISEVLRQKSGITRLTLTDFRNYEQLRIEPHIGPVVITGENGSGKTNILEAVSFLTPGRGLRSAKLSDVTRITSSCLSSKTPVGSKNFAWAVSAGILKNDEPYTLSTALQKTAQEQEDSWHTFDRRIVKIDSQKVPTQAELGKYLSALWITPQMDRIFSGGPQPRRSFLDRIVYMFDLEHAKRTSAFEHLYKEWYRLLKQGIKDNAWLSSLEEQMAATGVSIAAARRETIARLNTFLQNEPDDIFPDIRLELTGTCEQMLDTFAALDVEDAYANLLYQNRKHVLQNGSLEGINRTDFKVYFKKKNMPAELCSTGEQKSLLISLILAQTKCQLLDKGFAPVLLLDEVTTHLDDKKRDALLIKVRDLKLQAFLTSTDASVFKTLKDDAQFFTVHNNTLI